MADQAKTTHEMQLHYSADRRWVTVSVEGNVFTVPRATYATADLAVHRVWAIVNGKRGYSQGTLLMEVLRTFMDMGLGQDPEGPEDDEDASGDEEESEEPAADEDAA